MARGLTGGERLPMLSPLPLAGRVAMNCFRVALVLTASPLIASYGNGNERLEKLYSTFISPCCWTQNLTLHDSPIARELRERIQVMVSEGHSDEEIKGFFVRWYTKRILALPEGSERLWLMTIPWLAPAVALIELLFLLRRLQSSGQSARLLGHEPAELEPGWDLD